MRGRRQSFDRRVRKTVLTWKPGYHSFVQHLLYGRYLLKAVNKGGITLTAQCLTVCESSLYSLFHGNWLLCSYLLTFQISSSKSSHLTLSSSLSAHSVWYSALLLLIASPQTTLCFLQPVVHAHVSVSRALVPPICLFSSSDSNPIPHRDRAAALPLQSVPLKFRGFLWFISSW